MTEYKSEYELLREAKITRNNERLKTLGLLREQGDKRRRSNLSLSLSTPSPASSLKRTARSQNNAQLSSLIPVRRSVRLKNTDQSAAEKSETNDNDGIVQSNMLSLSVKKSRSISVPTIIKPQDIVQERGSVDDLYSRERKVTSSKSRDLSISIDSIMKSCLGKYVSSKMGKAAVIEFASKSPHVSFNKYSGVLEWKNSIFLWVNLGGPNTFMDGGEKVRE